MEDSLNSSSPSKTNTTHENRLRQFLQDDDHSFGESPHESSSMSSSWTEILAGYSDYVKRLEQGNMKKYNDQEEDDYYLHAFEDEGSLSYSNVLQQNASMVSDAGSGPDWRRFHSTSNHKHSVFMRRKLDVKRKRAKEVRCGYYDDSLEDTASSPVNSPKINLDLKKKMELHARRTNERSDYVSCEM